MNLIKQTKQIRSDFTYLITNSVINRLPAWWLRKLLYQALGMKIGKYCRIGLGTIVIYPKQIRMGDRVIINEHCFLDGRGGITVGDNVSISIYSKIITASHDINSDTFMYQHSPVNIDSFVFVGAAAILLEGTHLGKGCCIGAGSIVKGNYEAGSIYVGNPVKKLGERKSEYKYELFQNYYFR